MASTTTHAEAPQARDVTTTLHLSAEPAAVYAAVIDPRRWWSRTITGETDHVGAEFFFEVPGVHRTLFRITAAEPGRRVAWHAAEAWMGFVADPEEWTGTDVTFEIVPRGGGTDLHFTHRGLTPDVECYDACSTAWTSYLHASLANLAEGRPGDPNQEGR